jgi:hypothetical protein
VTDHRPVSAPAYPFDARPLIEPVDAAAARAFSQELRRTGRMPAANVVGIIVIAVVGIVFVSVLFTMVGTIVAVAASSAGDGIGFLLLTAIPVVIVVALVVGVVVVAVLTRRAASARMLRLDRFARANGMGYLPRLANPALPGMIFSLGSSRQASDLVRGDRPRFVEFANYRYTTGSGKNRSTHTWGYVAVKLDVPLPHIVLDATGNNGLFGSNLPATFDKDQRLSLEGDFDRFFSLYCPTGYETDALYLFTPDIMARFIDNAAALDVEIVDDWLFLYAKRDFSTLDPATWAWLFSVVGAVARRTTASCRGIDDSGCLRTDGRECRRRDEPGTRRRCGGRGNRSLHAAARGASPSARRRAAGTSPPARRALDLVRGDGRRRPVVDPLASRRVRHVLQPLTTPHPAEEAPPAPPHRVRA